LRIRRRALARPCRCGRFAAPARREGREVLSAVAAILVELSRRGASLAILTLFALSLSGINAAILLNVTLVTDLVYRARDVGKAIGLTILSGNICGP
jgi:hypothetical protein